MDEDAVTERDLADVGGRAAVHRQTVAALAYDLDGAASGARVFGEQSREACGVGAADGHAGA